jgi:hypothetical protein
LFSGQCLARLVRLNMFRHTPHPSASGFALVQHVVRSSHASATIVKGLERLCLARQHLVQSSSGTPEGAGAGTEGRDTLLPPRRFQSRGHQTKLNVVGPRAVKRSTGCEPGWGERFLDCLRRCHFRWQSHVEHRLGSPFVIYLTLGGALCVFSFGGQPSATGGGSQQCSRSPIGQLATIYM